MSIASSYASEDSDEILTILSLDLLLDTLDHILTLLIVLIPLGGLSWFVRLALLASNRRRSSSLRSRRLSFGRCRILRGRAWSSGSLTELLLRLITQFRVLLTMTG